MPMTEEEERDFNYHLVIYGAIAIFMCLLMTCSEPGSNSHSPYDSEEQIWPPVVE